MVHSQAAQQVTPSSMYNDSNEIPSEKAKMEEVTKKKLRK